MSPTRPTGCCSSNSPSRVHRRVDTTTTAKNVQRVDDLRLLCQLQRSQFVAHAGMRMVVVSDNEEMLSVRTSDPIEMSSQLRHEMMVGLDRPVVGRLRASFQANDNDSDRTGSDSAQGLVVDADPLARMAVLPRIRYFQQARTLRTVCMVVGRGGGLPWVLDLAGAGVLHAMKRPPRALQLRQVDDSATCCTRAEDSRPVEGRATTSLTSTDR